MKPMKHWNRDDIEKVADALEASETPEPVKPQTEPEPEAPENLVAPQELPRRTQLLLTLLYALGMGLMCLWVGFHLNRWIFLAFRWDTTVLIWGLMAIFFASSLITGRKYLVAGGKLRTYLCGVSTFLMMWLSIGYLVSDIFCRLTWRNSLADVRRSGWYVVLFVGLLALYSYQHRKAIHVRKLTLPLVEGPCRVVLISDLHIGYYVGKYHIGRMVAQINALKPDCVLIAGDLFNSGNTAECKALAQVTLLLGAIKAPVYAITGNHDPEPKNRYFRKFLQIADIHLLDDEVITNAQFQLAGRRTCTLPRKPLADLMAERSRPLIVLDHDPKGIPEAVEQKAALVLCGHTHRGQVFPLNLFVRLAYQPWQIYGLSKQEGTHVYVTSGAGYFSMPMRLGSSCEVVCLDIGTPKPEPPAEESAPEEAPTQETSETPASPS